MCGFYLIYLAKFEIPENIPLTFKRSMSLTHTVWADGFFFFPFSFCLMQAAFSAANNMS